MGPWVSQRLEGSPRCLHVLGGQENKVFPSVLRDPGRLSERGPHLSCGRFFTVPAPTIAKLELTIAPASLKFAHSLKWPLLRGSVPLR